MFKIKGTVHHVGEAQQVTEKFAKRELVISENSNEDYPQFISFETHQDNVTILDGFKNGEEIEVSFNLRGREWTSPQGEVRYFNTLVAWRVEKCSENVVEMSVPNGVETPTPASAKDDLPF